MDLNSRTAPTKNDPWRPAVALVGRTLRFEPLTTHIAPGRPDTIILSPYDSKHHVHFPPDSDACLKVGQSRDWQTLKRPLQVPRGLMKGAIRDLQRGASVYRFQKVCGARVNRLHALPNVDDTAFYYYARSNASAVPARRPRT